MSKFMRFVNAADEWRQILVEPSWEFGRFFSSISIRVIVFQFFVNWGSLNGFQAQLGAALLNHQLSLTYGKAKLL